jgi:hypothetical protein
MKHRLKAEATSAATSLSAFGGLLNFFSGRLEAGAWSLTGFELALKDEGGEGELLFWQAELGAEKDPTDFGLADAAEFLEGQGASAAGGRQDRQRVERCDPRRLGRGYPE